MLSDTWLRQDMMDLILRNARFDKFNLMNCVLIRFPIMPCKPMLAHKGQHTGPCGIGTRVSNAALIILSYHNGGSHRKDCLNECTEGQLGIRTGIPRGVGDLTRTRTRTPRYTCTLCAGVGFCGV